MFQTVLERFMIGGLPRLLPGGPLPSARQRFVFEFVEIIFANITKAGLQGAEPVIVRPAEGNGAQGVARQLGERVVRHRLAPVEKERDFVTAKHALQDIVIALQASQQQGAVPITSAAADVSQYLARGECRLGLRTRTNGDAQRLA